MNNIKKMRGATGLTQNDVATRLKIQQSTVAMWETGESMPRAGLLPKLAKLLNCSIDALFDTEQAAAIESQAGTEE